MVSKPRGENHVPLILWLDAILPQVSRRMGHEIPLQGSSRFDAGPYPLDYLPEVQSNGRLHREGRVGSRPCPYVSDVSTLRADLRI